MNPSMTQARRATEGNDVGARFHEQGTVETHGNSISCACLTAAVDHSVVPRKVLADEVGQSESQFSKSLSGLKGGDFTGVVDRIRPAIRLDYARRLAELGREGGLEDLAAEELAHAAIRYLSARRLPTKAHRVAKAGLR